MPTTRKSNPDNYYGSLIYEQKAQSRDCNVRKILRPLKRYATTRRRHPIYVARESKEHELLEQLIADNPPEGGMGAYIADLRKPG